MEKLESIAIKACAVSRCDNPVSALIVASRDTDVQSFYVCEKHLKGVRGAVQAKFVPQDYAVVTYAELLKKQ
ncbi:MAG: hypothetical protein PHO02_02595 [Candidatus Nanoarchaeia archaeon]|nr:hypothetical protein [Candidatus Nanoarchaeia archaeon]